MLPEKAMESNNGNGTAKSGGSIKLPEATGSATDGNIDWSCQMVLCLSREKLCVNLNKARMQITCHLTQIPLVNHVEETLMGMIVTSEINAITTGC